MVKLKEHAYHTAFWKDAVLASLRGGSDGRNAVDNADRVYEEYKERLQEGK